MVDVLDSAAEAATMAATAATARANGRSDKSDSSRNHEGPASSRVRRRRALGLCVVTGFGRLLAGNRVGQLLE